jgi:prevent-host-death family protein
MQTLPLATVKARLSEFVDRVHGQQDRIVITRNGRPAAVLVSVDDLEGLEETLEILSDPEAMADLRQAQEDLAAGRVLRGEQLAAFFEEIRRRATTE